jgi:hypothetical protein
VSTPERPGLAGNFIAGLIEAGFNATRGLDEFRSAGGAIRTQTWYRAWSEVVSALERAVSIGQADIGRRPTAGEWSPGSWRTKQRYSFQVDVLVRPRGTSEVFRMPMTVTSDRALTFGQAIGSALGSATTDLEQYDEEVLGGVVTGAYDRELWEG